MFFLSSATKICTERQPPFRKQRKGAFMKPSNHSEFYETISHTTASAPYSIHYTRVFPDFEPALYLHWHTEMEFFLLAGGELCFHIEDKTYPLHAGECIFIPPGLLHYANSTGAAPVSFHAFVLSPDFLFSSFDTRLYNTYLLPVMHNNLPLAVTLSDSVSWQKDILHYLQLIFAASEQDELYIRGLSLLIWNRLYQHHIITSEAPKTLYSLAEQLAKPLSYLHENYCKSLTLSELAALVPLSEAQFCRSFRRLTGMTPFHYLNRYRILQSCAGLLHTDDKITEIALSNGFNNISYYNRAFLRLMNMTPSEYRRTMTGAPHN